MDNLLQILNSTVLIAIIGAAGTLITFFITRYKDNKDKRDYQLFLMKKNIFIAYVLGITNNLSRKEQTAFILARNKMLIIASAKTIKKLLAFEEVYEHQKDYSSIEQYDIDFTKTCSELIQAIRDELSYRNKKINIDFPEEIDFVSLPIER